MCFDYHDSYLKSTMKIKDDNVDFKEDVRKH
jgi:hypothetical protein